MEQKTSFVRCHTHLAYGTLHGTIYMNQQHQQQSCPTLNIEEHYDTKLTHKRVSTANSLPHSKFCYFLFRHNPLSHIQLLHLVFFHSAMTPNLSMYTTGSIECKGQVYTAVRIPHRSGTRGSHKQLSKVWIQLYSTKWSYSYHPETHTSRLYSTRFLTLPQIHFSVRNISPCDINRLVPCLSLPEWAKVNFYMIQYIA